MIMTKVGYIYDKDNEFDNHKMIMEQRGYRLDCANWIKYNDEMFAEVIYSKLGVDRINIKE